MPDDDLSALSEYERRAYRQLAERKKKELERSPRQLVPAKVREAAEKRAGALKNKVSEFESRQAWLGKVGDATLPNRWPSVQHRSVSIWC
jgi:hypothetical protein